MPGELSRRRFLGFLSAPAIVRASSLMPVRSFLLGDINAIQYIGPPGVELDNISFLSRGAIRDLLLPGLRVGQYDPVSAFDIAAVEREIRARDTDLWEHICADVFQHEIEKMDEERSATSDVLAITRDVARGS